MARGKPQRTFSIMSEQNTLVVNEWADLYYRDIYRVCLARLRNKEEAEDATQGVFEKVLRKNSYQPDLASPRTWLCTIAFNYCTDLLRSRSRKNKLVSSLTNLLGIDNHQMVAVAQDLDLAIDLGRAFKELDEEDRVLLDLRYMRKYTCSEIALILDLPNEKEVYKRLQNAKNRARVVMGLEDLR